MMMMVDLNLLIGLGILSALVGPLVALLIGLISANLADQFCAPPLAYIRQLSATYRGYRVIRF